MEYVGRSLLFHVPKRVNLPANAYGERPATMPAKSRLLAILFPTLHAVLHEVGQRLLHLGLLRSPKENACMSAGAVCRRPYRPSGGFLPAPGYAYVYYLPVLLYARESPARVRLIVFHLV